MVKTLQERHEQQRRSYRRLCRGYGLPRSNVLRWQYNLRRGDPPIRRPGPPKQGMPDQALLNEVIAALPCGSQRTKGTGALYDAWRGFISRDMLAQLVADHRRNLHRTQRDQLQLLCWYYPGTVWAMDEAEMDGIRWLLVVDLASRYRFDLLLSDTCRPRGSWHTSKPSSACTSRRWRSSATTARTWLPGWWTNCSPTGASST